MKKIRIGSVFSGAGAFEYAIKKSNLEFETIFACDNGEIDIDIDYQKEYDKIIKMGTPEEKRIYVENLYKKATRKRNYMREIYLANNNIINDNFFYDINLLDGNDFKNKIDILVGGSPCQSFSTVGKQLGFNDTRGTLFHEYSRILKETKPRLFIFENVRGFFTHDKGKTWAVVKNTFIELGYKIKFSILNSKDYGIPQNRNRIFIVGFLSEDDYENFEFPEKIELKWTMQDFLESNVAPGNFKNVGGDFTIKKRSRKSKVKDRYFLTPGVEKYVMSHGTKGWKQKPIIDLSVARPLLKTMGNHHRAGTDNYVTEFKKIRMLTERESFRLQGFGDDYEINISPAQGYKIAGNSIPINILLKIFDKLNLSSS